MATALLTIISMTWFDSAELGLTEENICHIADTLRSLHKDYGELKPYIEYQIGETRPATEGDN